MHDAAMTPGCQLDDVGQLDEFDINRLFLKVN